MEAENTKAPTLAEFQEVLSQGRYAIRDVDTLKGVLCDAFILYDVTEGRGRLSELLTLGEKKADPEPSHRQDNSGRHQTDQQFSVGDIVRLSPRAGCGQSARPVR
jgi:hypothetical protein